MTDKETFQRAKVLLKILLDWFQIVHSIFEPFKTLKYHFSEKGVCVIF